MDLACADNEGGKCHLLQASNELDRSRAVVRTRARTNARVLDGNLDGELEQKLEQERSIPAKLIT